MGLARTVAKNSFFNLIATASDVVINLFIGIALARGLGTGEYGLYALLMWCLSLAVLVVNLGMGEMAKRFVAESLGQQNTGRVKGVVRMALLLRGSAALLAALVIVGASGLLARTFASPDDQVLFILLACSLLPNVLNLAFISIFAGFQKYEYGAYLLLGTNPLRAVVVIALVVLGFGLQEVLIANLAAWCLGVLIGIVLLRRLIPLNKLRSAAPLERDARRGALKYAATIAGITGVNFLLWRQAEVLLLGLYGPVEEVGFYTLASKLPLMAMLFVPSVLGAVLLPAMSEQFGRNDMERIRRIYTTSARYLVMLALPVAVAGIALATPLITVVYGEDYAPSVVLLQILFLPFAVKGIASAAGSVIYAINRPMFILKAGLVLGLMNIGLNLWLIPQYGMMGAAVASSVPRLIALPVYVRFASGQIGAAWPLGDTARIAGAALLMGLALFGLQSHVGAVLSLVLAVPLGLVLYVAALVALRTVRAQDLYIAREVQKSLPAPLRKNYAALVSLAGKLAGIEATPTKG